MKEKNSKINKKSKKIKVSLICTTYNEENNIGDFINSILKQTRLPDEILIVDSLSKDKTVSIIKSFKLKFMKIISKKCNRSEGRNIAIQNSKYNYILCSDAGCILDKRWVENMIKAFDGGKIDYVMGNFKTMKKGIKQHLMGLISLQSEKKLASDPYFASARSIGFKKSVWKEVGGFPKNLNTGEDTKFNLMVKQKKYAAKFARNAMVHWLAPTSIRKFTKQFFSYGYGDGESRNIFKMPGRLAAVLVYLLGHIVFIGCLFVNWMLSLAIVLIYLVLVFLICLKHIKTTDNFLSIFLVPFLIYLKRTSYMIGAIYGIIKKK